MENSVIASLSVPNYVELVIAMAELQNSTPNQVNADYCFWHGVVSEERYKEAKAYLKELEELCVEI